MKFKDLFEDAQLANVSQEAKDKVFSRIREFRPFLEKTNGLPWFRGVNDFSTVSSYETIRNDRIPRSSTSLETNFFNLFAELKFGECNLRNRCLFAQQSMMSTHVYGRINLVFMPTDSWVLTSPIVQDMYKLNAVGKFGKILFDKNTKNMVAYDRCLKIMGDIDSLKFSEPEFYKECLKTGIDKHQFSSFIYEVQKFMDSLNYRRIDFDDFGSVSTIPGTNELMLFSESPYLRVDMFSLLSLYFTKDEIKSFTVDELQNQVRTILKREAMR